MNADARRNRFEHSLRQFLLIALWLTIMDVVHAQNPIYGLAAPPTEFTYFMVTNIPANTVYPANNPALNLTAGATYQLIIGTASFHPVVIATNNTGNFLSPPINFSYSNASPQAVFSGSITITLPATNYPTTLYYQCNVHDFFGVINVLPPPPPNQITSLSVTTNVILVSTGVTNTWVFVPEFSSNLVSGVWSPVPAYTNSFANGTNVTVFNRLEPICGPNVFLRVSLSPPN
jgi:hypothetical protein